MLDRIPALLADGSPVFGIIIVIIAIISVISQSKQKQKQQSQQPKRKPGPHHPPTQPGHPPAHNPFGHRVGWEKVEDIEREAQRLRSKHDRHVAAPTPPPLPRSKPKPKPKKEDIFGFDQDTATPISTKTIAQSTQESIWGPGLEPDDALDFEYKVDVEPKRFRAEAGVKASGGRGARTRRGVGKLRRKLGLVDQRDLVRAVLMAEILSPPLAVREDPTRDDSTKEYRAI